MLYFFQYSSYSYVDRVYRFESKTEIRFYSWIEYQKKNKLCFYTYSNSAWVPFE